MSLALAPRFDRDLGPYLAHPLDPRTDDFDEVYTRDRALDQATDECDATPAQFADWLAKVTDVPPKRAGYEPQNIRHLERRFATGDDLQPWELAALMIAGRAQHVMRARQLLLELYREAHGEQILQRARQLVEQSGGDPEAVVL